MHFFDSRYPLSPNARRREPDASVDDYRAVQRRLGLERVVIVQPTAYGADNRCTLDAIAAIGDAARGIAIVPPTVGDDELRRLHRAGMRGVRFRMTDRPDLPWDALPAMAARIAVLGWHIQFQMDGRDLAAREAMLGALPCDLVVEHVGKFLDPVPVTHPGFQALLRLLANGRTWVKLSGAYMTSKAGPPGYEDVSALARALVVAAPERMVWATNWPHPLAARTGATPDEAALLDLLADWAPDARVRDRILADNPARLYGFAAT
jgi:D-galactarolactone isomerase